MTRPLEIEAINGPCDGFSIAIDRIGNQVPPEIKIASYRYEHGIKKLVYRIYKNIPGTTKYEYVKDE